MMKIFKETSLIAIFSFLLAVFTWLILIVDEFFSVTLSHTFVCEIRANISGVAALSGVIALIYIKKTKLRGRWLAILAIILGAFGFFMVCL